MSLATKHPLDRTTWVPRMCLGTVIPALKASLRQLGIALEEFDTSVHSQPHFLHEVPGVFSSLPQRFYLDYNTRKLPNDKF